MPRNPGTGIYTKPYPDVISDTTIESTVHNGEIADIETDLNTPRPIVAGGTGANNAATARDNLDTEVAAATVTNFDTQVWECGSFWCGPNTTAAPTVNAFAGTCIILAGTPQYIMLEARDASTGRMYTRIKSTTWGAWTAQDADYVNTIGDTMTGDLIIDKANPALWLRKGLTSEASAIYGQIGGSARWLMMLGDNSGSSNFVLRKFDDAGANPVDVISIDRSALAMTMRAPNPTIIQRKDTNGGINQIWGYTAALPRWMMTLGNEANETGSGNAGSNFALFRYNDAGALIDSPLSIARADGRVLMNTSRTATAQMGAAPYSGFPCVIELGYPGSTTYAINYRPLVDSANAAVFLNSANTAVGTITQSTAATAYNTSSDGRLKEDLKSFDAGSIIDDTNVYDFKWKSTGERAYGVVGQEAAEIYPTAVTHLDEMDWYGVDYSKYVPVLLQELKALRARVAELEGKISAGIQPP